MSLITLLNYRAVGKMTKVTKAIEGLNLAVDFGIVVKSKPAEDNPKVNIYSFLIPESKFEDDGLIEIPVDYVDVIHGLINLYGTN